MSEFRFFAYEDFQFHTNGSQNLLNLPITPFHATKRTTTDEISHELNVPYTVFEILVAIFAVIGNLMVIIVFQRERKLRRRTNYYIVSLAMADFLVGSLGIPFAVLASIGLPSNLYACLFTVSLLVVLCTISIFCLVAVSVDRYWAILYPMAYSRNVRTKTAIIIISMCWVAGTVVGFLPLFGWHADVGPDQACLFVEVMDYNYLVFLYFATIITPALLMLAFYAHIYRVIVKQVRQIVLMNPVGDCSRRSSTTNITTSSRPCHGGTMLRVLGAARKRDVKATQNLSIIVLFFMICWIPLYTINCIKAFCPDCYVHPKLTLFCIILSHLNSAVNPVLYAYHLKDFRAALKSLILKVMGVEIEQPVEVIHRFSLASNHRLQSVDANIRSLQPRIYIDSPIWLRQQQQTPRNPPSYGVVSPCLSNIHQTVAAVASMPADIERSMWNIMEASSGAELGEVSYEFPSENAQNTPTPPPRHKRSTLARAESCDNPYTYTNRNYTCAPDEVDCDEVFLPNKATVGTSEQNHAHIACSMRDKLRSDDIDYQTRLHASQQALTDSSQSDYEIPRRPLAANGKLTLISASHSPQHLNLTMDRSGAISQTTSNPAIYVIDNLTDPHKPKYKRPHCPSMSFSKPSKAISRSCSCTSESSTPTKENAPTALSAHSNSNSSSSLTALGGGGVPNANSNNNNLKTTNNLNYYTFQQQTHNTPATQHHPEKFSPLKAVSNFIFPPIVKHSSLFHLFQQSPPTDNSTAPAVPPAPTIAGGGEGDGSQADKANTVTPEEDSTLTLVTEVERQASALVCAAYS